MRNKAGRYNLRLFPFYDVRLVIAARSEDKLNITAAECGQYTDTIITVVADVGREEDCYQIVDVAAEKLGGVDILVLNAAYSPLPSFFSDMESPVSYTAKEFNRPKCNIISLNKWTSFLGHYNIDWNLI